MRVWPGLDPPFTWSQTKRNKNRYTDTHTESQLSHSQSCRQPRHSYIYQGDLIVASQSFILWYSIPLSRCLCLVLVLSFLTHTDTHTRQRLRSRTRTKMELKTRRSFYFLKKECCFDSLNSCVMILSVDMVIIFSAINTQPQTAVRKDCLLLHRIEGIFQTKITRRGHQDFDTSCELTECQGFFTSGEIRSVMWWSCNRVMKCFCACCVGGAG